MRKLPRTRAGTALLGLMRTPGPGVIASAADLDPTTVATLSVLGATTGYGLSWLVILVIPMLVIVLVISATVGVVTRDGLEDVVRKRYGRSWAVITLLLVIVVNVLTLAADLEGGSAALGLLTRLPYQWFIVPMALAVGALLTWGSYAALQRVFRYVLLLFLAYVVTAFLARPDWSDVLAHTVIPHLDGSPTYVMGTLALLGTTLTSYVYMWETIEQAEERPPLRLLRLAQIDAGAGMVMAGGLMWCIVITTGATLGVHHTEVQTAQDAAAALAPLAGPYASVVFGVGLLASAVVAVPVLAGTSAYVLAEMFGWRGGLSLSFGQAPAFYVALLLSLFVAVGVSVLGVGPIQLLFASSIAGGLGTPVTLGLLVLVARDNRVMGEHRIGRKLAFGGWLVTAVVTASGAIFLWQTLSGSAS